MEFTLAVVLASLVMMVQGCTVNLAPGVMRQKDGFEKDEMKVYFSDSVVFGTVLEVTNTSTAGVKNVKFEVECSYKGRVHTKIIHITGAGNKKGQIPGCPKAMVKPNERVVMFLKNLPDKSGGPWYEVEFAPLTGEPMVFIDDLTFVCGLELTTGGDVMGHDDCSEPLSTECEKYILPTTTTTAPETNNKVTTDVVVGPPNPENNGDDGNVNDQTYETKTDKPAESSDKEKAVGTKGGDNGSAPVSISALLVLLFSLIATVV